MIRSELRIVCAATAVFAALIGLYRVLDGLVFDAWSTFRYGAATLIVGVAGFVLLLNPGSRDPTWRDLLAGLHVAWQSDLIRMLRNAPQTLGTNTQRGKPAYQAVIHVFVHVGRAGEDPDGVAILHAANRVAVIRIHVDGDDHHVEWPHDPDSPFPSAAAGHDARDQCPSRQRLVEAEASSEDRAWRRASSEKHEECGYRHATQKTADRKTGPRRGAGNFPVTGESLGSCLVFPLWPASERCGSHAVRRGQRQLRTACTR